MRPAEFEQRREHRPGISDYYPTVINRCWCGWEIPGANVQLEPAVLAHRLDHLEGRIQ